MKNLLARLIAIGAALAVASLVLPVVASAQTPLKRTREQMVSIVARVEAINMATREITLKGPQGNVETFTVDKRVERLGELKIGDEVIADYYESIAAELRAPTAAEKANPIQVLTETAKAPAGAQPAAGALRITKAVVTVEGLNRPTRSLTVNVPPGRYLTVYVEDVAALSQLRLGDTLVVTYTEALAVSLEKRVPKK